LLLGITVVLGIVWGVDSLFFRPARVAAARAAGRDPAQLPEPGTVDYARSFFPVALVVLLLRAFIFEPFRIPSDSMMPTLLDGDFIIVNKYAYGLRLPVINKKVVAIGEPPSAATWWCSAGREIRPSTSIKRLVGLPGDHIEGCATIHVYINGFSQVPSVPAAQHFPTDGCYVNFTLAYEHLGRRPLRHVLPGGDRPPPGAAEVQPLGRPRVCLRGRGFPGEHADPAV
jgi:signal peptidase I